MLKVGREEEDDLNRVVVIEIVVLLRFTPGSWHARFTNAAGIGRGRGHCVILKACKV
jgi:hypothetical protein